MLPLKYAEFDCGRAVVGNEPNATEPETSNAFLGLVVPIPVLAVVPRIVPLSKISELPSELTPVNLERKLGLPKINPLTSVD